MAGKKTIWMINQDATTPNIGYAGRSYYLANELGKLGHQVYLIAGSFSHLHFTPSGVKKAVEIQNEENFTMVWIKLPSYAQAHSKKRILNWFLFGYRVGNLLNKIKDSPDIIYYSSPPLIGFLGAYKLKKLSKAKLFFEFRDIWPMTLKEIGGYKNSNPLIKIMDWIEKLAYKNSDFIISNLSNAFEYLKDYGIAKDQFLWIPNGVSLEEFEEKIPLRPEIAQNIPKDKFIVGYSGTLGVANALDYLMKASNQLQSNKEIVIVIVGTGREKEKLEKMVKGNSQVLFFDAVQKSEIYSLLDRFDVCYLGWKKHNIYHYGIGSNKMPEYLLSGKPILNSYSGACDLVAQAGAGFSFEAEDPIKIKEHIEKVFEMNEEERKHFGNKGQKFAEKILSYNILAKQIDQHLN
jgi:glycosyltransferase involved in cell wall biosynthesis